MTRVTSVEGGQVITTGLVNMRRFEQRGNETLVVAELFERPVQVRTEEGEVVDATVEDIGIEQLGTRGWSVARAFVRTGADPRAVSAGSGAAGARRCSWPSRTSSGCGTPPRARAPPACSRRTRTSSPPTSPRSSTT